MRWSVLISALIGLLLLGQLALMYHLYYRPRPLPEALPPPQPPRYFLRPVILAPTVGRVSRTSAPPPVSTPIATPAPTPAVATARPPPAYISGAVVSNVTVDPGHPPAVDAVWTWVNGSDPVWQRIKQQYDPPPRTLFGRRVSKSIGNKYREHDELRFSLRSIWMNAPWIRNLIIVTDGQVPYWLDCTHPRVRVVDHRELFDDPTTQLPTYNSLAIESVLHRIPGLSEFFLYLNNGSSS
jgi:hypothetical protein